MGSNGRNIMIIFFEFVVFDMVGMIVCDDGVVE